MRYSKEEIATATAQLRKILKPGDTVHCVLRHVSRSGRFRRIDFYKLGKGGERFLSGYIAKVLGLKLHDDGGLGVSGCGMDMGFHVVYGLSSTLWPRGFKCLGEGKPGRRCPANDHSNGDRDYTKGHLHPHAGGYALRHAWL